MATWIRDDRLVALGRVDVSQNQFVRYPNSIPSSAGGVNPENPLGGVFSDLPAVSILDASEQRFQDREIQEVIKPNMRMIHYILGKLMNLGPGQYILGHKRNDINATIYKAVQVEGDKTGESITATDAKGKKGVSSASRGQYDLHAAHEFSPQMLSEVGTDGTGGNKKSANSNISVGVADEDLQLQWIGTPDQIPGTFPYDEPKRGKRFRGGAKAAAKRRKIGKIGHK
ncbi:hypothetical protein BC939DRAFT_468276 [Gamsiella multidivaricata]|uniref:uncharacterized protein n=1 Tax=Gamsiella multidivaricata TaxID=101098 RepID=UPI00221F8C45|nr:uncharacterized protein BC939DRAFT_468276 [Gamsiella multidivaricata]KAI7816648.1 hypothetical protein BC939DRAFT_468276 [Gamsiella multidivaricata]